MAEEPKKSIEDVETTSEAIGFDTSASISDTGSWHVLKEAQQIARGNARPQADERVIDLAEQLTTLMSMEMPESLLECFDALLLGPDAQAALQWLHDIGILSLLIPEVSVLDGFHENYPVDHKDLWRHSLEVLGRTEANADLRWVALMHDTGKVATRSMGAKGQVTFYGHERVSAWLMRGVGGRFNMSPGRIARICFIIEHHGRVNAYRRGWTDKAVRRLIRDTGERLDAMMSFAEADFTTKRRERVSKIKGRLKHLGQRIETMRNQESDTNDLPPGLGNGICEALQRTPGPWVGEAMGWLRAEIHAGRLASGADIATYIKALVDQKG